MADSIYVPDCLFPSDNELEVPTLRLDRQPDCAAIPFVCFGEQKRTFKMNGTGTLHFYTDDYRFNAIYEHPERILAHNPMNIVEPNWSLFNETPIAFGLQAIYKKRWLARAMQEQGIGVFVDLNVANKFISANLLGVPRGYGAFCTRGYSDRIPALEMEYMVALRVAAGNPLTFVVYGGGEPIKAWCRKNGCVYVTPIITIKNKQKAIARMEQNIAQISQGALFPETLRLPSPEDGVVSDFEHQVLNFHKDNVLPPPNKFLIHYEQRQWRHKSRITPFSRVRKRHPCEQPLSVRRREHRRRSAESFSRDIAVNVRPRA